MPDIPTTPLGSNPSPPKPFTSSQPIFGYQARLLQRTSSTKTSGTPISGSSGLTSSLANMAMGPPAPPNGTSPPSTPITRSVKRMVAEGNRQNGPEFATPGLRGSAGLSKTPSSISSHTRGSQSVSSVRNQWQAKINKLSTTPLSEASLPPNGSQQTPKSLKRSTFSPDLTTGMGFALSNISTPSSIIPIRTGSSTTDSVPDVNKYQSDFMASKTAKRSTVFGMEGITASPIPTPIERPSTPPSSSSVISDQSPTTRQRPASVSSYASILSPHSTGESSVTSGRTQAQEEKLAAARANALKRLEARRKAQAEAAGEGNATMKATASQDIPAEVTIRASPPAAPITSTPEPTAVRSSPFAHLFEPPSSNTEKTPTKPTFHFSEDVTPTSSRSYISRSTAASSTTPAPSAAPSYVPSGLSVPAASSTSSGPGLLGGKDKYGSISKTDRRRLGRHLPRIASGGEGWDEEVVPGHKDTSEKRIPSILGRNAIAPSKTENTPPIPTPDRPSTSAPSSRPRAMDVLAPSTTTNHPNTVPSQSIPSTPSKRRSVMVAEKLKESLASTPRPEVAGEEMKGLMSAVGALGVRGRSKEGGEGVTGMANRFRLSKSSLPPSASSAALAPAPLPSRKLAQTNWMDRQRHALQAYEYLCHVGEAQQWIEGCLDEELDFGVTEMEEGLRDGVVLAKLARVFLGESAVKHIYTDGKHRYKQTENINYFLRLLRSVGMPETFIFEVTDLYNKRNIPKVIFCIHVLSHLLSRLGRAERIGNLVGQFEFTDEQLAATQKGLQGVPMPNFGDVRNTLAKEASWEPEEPEETEDEKRDRELIECEPSIINLQSHLRGRLARAKTSRIRTQLDLALPIITRIQSQARGHLARQILKAERTERSHLSSWATGLQAIVRTRIATTRWQQRILSVRRSEASAVGIQAHARGMLARVRLATIENALDKSSRHIVNLQAICRGCLARRRRSEHRRAMSTPEMVQTIRSLQAVSRGRLQRQAAAQQQLKVHSQMQTFLAFQSHLRGALVRRTRRAHEEKLDNAADYIVSIQAVCRGILARRKKQSFISTAQTVAPAITSLQSALRARLAKKSHRNMQKALAKVEVAGSVGGLQAFLRTKLAKRQATEQKKQLEFVQPDVIGFQAIARGYLARQEYREWRDYLFDPHTQGALVFLQSLIRGFLARRRLYLRTSYIHSRIDSIVKIQALWRGRTERQMYHRLLTGMEVDVPTIQNYMHLLNDTESDFRDQIRTDLLRKQVVELIRENQILETDVKDLDTKIALIVNNKMTFEELARAKRRAGQGQQEQIWHQTNMDPFGGGAHLDKGSQRKLELYEGLFFLLQTKAEYLSRLIRGLKGDEVEKDRKMVEGVVLVLFGYERREEYLFHKLLQLAVHEEILLSTTLSELAEHRFPIVSVTKQYAKPSVTPYVQEIMSEHILRVVQAQDLDLCTDPLEIYNRSINAEESQTGLPSPRPRDLNADQVLQIDAPARAEYIQHLQELRFLCDRLIKGLVASTVHVPYTIRLLARESLLALRVKYPDAFDHELTPVVAKTVILPFLLPAIIAPETFGILDTPIGAIERRNLAAIASLVTHVASQDLSSSTKDRFIRVPLQEYIRADGEVFRDWIMELASVEPLETYFQTHELFESALEAKPISITRNEIYGMLGVMVRHLAIVSGGKTADPVAKILEELEGPPLEYDKSKIPISLRLTNRLAQLQSNDDDAPGKEDWVQAKRHVLAVLRIQSGRTLFDVLVARPEQIHEQMWIQEVHRDMALEAARQGAHQLPPTPVEKEYQIESIRSLPFHEVKCRAIEFCMRLESLGRLSRADAFQGLLVSIAGDIRQKHHLRKMQKQSLVAMTRAYEDLSAKKRKFEEQIKSYHDYIDSSMASLQAKGKKKPTFLSKQYRHQRHEAKLGKKSRFGSYAYTATELYDRGILLAIDQFSPRQYDKVTLVIASDEVGVFSLEMASSASAASSTLIGHEELRMEDLLQAQFDNEQSLLLFDGMATFSINMLIHQINKKFYS
ncbi:hypothetical protein M231_06282 [Tremella mesenterica]|uniref:IQ domain-containing GTPase activating protein n=1 Tax=Tremella mesenterica TaxID=5217 RepID=A0A4Q1BC73_TREME|nr:hypothetical protein M231_06282 [Tremella mesenterica]